jgi:glycerol-3-phosphate acyltransferase PlsX
MKIAVDAMGGDNAPEVVVQGAVQAASELGLQVTLIGDKKLIAVALGSQVSSNHIAVHHCEEVVQMDESPLKAVRKKKDASIRVAFDLVKKGEANAVVSAGNSGATLAAGVLTLGRLKGVERPAIAGIFPGEKGHVVLIDMGANVDCRPAQLFQFGIMGHAFASSCLGMKNPKVGLLSIGEEDSKGNEQVRLTHELFEQSLLNFRGNVEGRDVFSGDVQIIVCDGFVGNVALKLVEGMAESMTNMLKTELKRSFLGRVALLLSRQSLKGFKRDLDYEEYGGAPLLGINGIGIVCHGGSSVRAIRNAVKTAAMYVENRVVQKMVEELNTMMSNKTY